MSVPGLPSRPSGRCDPGVGLWSARGASRRLVVPARRLYAWDVLSGRFTLKIFWSMSGEGRGHATRVRALVERLRSDDLEFTLFAPGDAHDFLAPLYHGSDVRVVQIPGLRFEYRDCRLDTRRTLTGALRYLMGFRRLIRRLEREIRDARPELVVTDFEPALPRAARRCGVPFLSLDHQHFLVVCDLSELPATLRRKAWLMRRVVSAYYSGQIETVVSSFYRLPMAVEPTGPTTGEVRQIGVILRDEVLRAVPTEEGHLVAYLRRFAPDNVLDALRRSGREVRVYGLPPRPDAGSLRFRRVDSRAFVRDLASADALITTAGNQIVGEALHLRKPVLMMPEANNHEQFMNAWCLSKLGAGEWVELQRCRPHDVQRFLGELPRYRARTARLDVDGSEDALRVIRRHVRPPVRTPGRAAAGVG